jgi:hypothetical protein
MAVWQVEAVVLEFGRKRKWLEWEWTSTLRWGQGQQQEQMWELVHDGRVLA